VKLRPLEPGDLDAAGALLHEAFARSARDHGHAPPWPDAATARTLAERELENGLCADVDGALAGIGFVRLRGDVATIGPLAALAPGRGTGGQILDELVARAEAHGAASVRLYQDGWNPSAFALHAGRSFAPFDVVACLERPAAPAPRLDAARGMEFAPFRAADAAEVATLDQRLTGLVRSEDLARQVRLVARRRGVIVGYLGVGAGRGLLGPALALDVADLGALIARALPDVDGVARARLSTAAPTAMLAALGLGFRVTAVGTLMVRGVSPPARPPQLYSIAPEVL
jgi:hypothetical protein